jgi:hypothetical protein
MKDRVTTHYLVAVMKMINPNNPSLFLKSQKSLNDNVNVNDNEKAFNGFNER